MSLEELLNKLIALGWKPRGKTNITNCESNLHSKGVVFNETTIYGGNYIDFSLNDLCSLDSGLWKFVCEKGLFDETDDGEITTQGYGIASIFNPRYYLMVSSIQPDKERFLLDNIKIND